MTTNDMRRVAFIRVQEEAFKCYMRHTIRDYDISKDWTLTPLAGGIHNELMKLFDLEKSLPEGSWTFCLMDWNKLVNAWHSYKERYV